MPKLGGPGVAGSIQAVRRSLGQGGGGNANRGKMLFIKADSSVRVRFLQEPEEFFIYDEHFDKQQTAAVPALDPDPLEDSDNPDLARTSRRQLVNVLNIETGDVQLLKMNQELAGRALVRYQKYKTLTDRDYEITRTGSGFDTSYDLVPESPEPIDLSRFRPKMHDMVLYLFQEADRYYGTDYSAEYLAEREGAPKGKKKSVLEDDDESQVAPNGSEKASKAEVAEKKTARQAAEKARLDEKWGDDLPFGSDDDADPFPDPLSKHDSPFSEVGPSGESAEPIVAEGTLGIPSSGDPWAEARAAGRPCRQGKNDLCEVCGFSILDCLSS